MSWRPSLRIAAREARRAKARSALIVAMVALPVVALSFADVMWRTAVPDGPERVARLLGTSQASVTIVDVAGEGSVVQAADPSSGHYLTVTTEHGAYSGASGPAGARLDNLRLPTGTSIVLERAAYGQRLRAGGGVSSQSWTEVDVADPTFTGRWTLLDGRVPAGTDEVALTPASVRRTGAALGDTVTLVDGDRPFTLVGVVAQEGERGLESVVAPPGALLGTPGGIPLERTEAIGFLLGSPVSWDDVLALNEQGAVVTSRAVLADPPPTTRFDQEYGSGVDLNLADYVVPALIVAMVVCLSGLIVVLLAGTAFAVGIRRQTRSLALVAAGGGDRRDVRRIVLAGGIVLGVVAGLVGVLLGVTLAGTADQLVWRLGWLAGADLASFDVRVPELLLIALIGVVTGILAAVVPARQASRIDVVAALRGRSGTGRRSWRTPVLGVVMAATGVVLTVLGSSWVVSAQRDPSTSIRTLVVAVLVGGAALVLLGLVLCAGTVVSVVTRIASRLPLAGRLALRDADRHRGRTAPAVAAVLAAVSGSVAVMMYVAALDDSDRQNYTPSAPMGTTTVNLTMWPDDYTQPTTYVDPARVEQVLSSALPVASTLVVQQVAPCTDTCESLSLIHPVANSCPVYDETPWDPSAGLPDDVPDDPRCNSTHTPQYWSLVPNSDIAIGGPELLAASGHPANEAAQAVLAAGGAVVTDPLLIDKDGKVRLVWFSAQTNAEQPPPGQEDGWTGPKPDVDIRIPALVVPAEETVVPSIVSPRALAGLDVTVAPVTVMVRTSEPVSARMEDRARAALLDQIGEGLTVNVERGYESTYGIGLLALAIAAGAVTLGATGIATGLALTDARADHATLAAVGAAPRLRRRLAAAQSLVVGLIGVLLGVAAGVVPALSIIGAVGSLQVVWPWPQLAALVVGIPLLAGAFAYVFTRSRVPLQRRVVA